MIVSLRRVLRWWQESQKPVRKKTSEGLKLPPEPVLGSLPSLPRLSPALALSIYPQPGPQLRLNTHIQEGRMRHRTSAY